MPDASKRLQEGMTQIQDAIIEGVRELGARVDAADFRWDFGNDITGAPQSVMLLVKLGPYRVFEQIFTRQDILLGPKHPDLEVFIAAAIARLTNRLAP